MPDLEALLRILTFRDHNTQVVVIGTMLLGLAAGIIGSYMILRKRTLIGDALSHATLPGIGLAFLFMVALGGTGKSLPGLLLGATITGGIGVAAVLFIRMNSRIKEDAALGIVLSVSFGLGVAILGLIQSMPQANAAGLESFIYGRTASMLRADTLLLAGCAAITALAAIAFAKEFMILSFDPEYATALGWPVLLLDAIMMGLVIAVTVIGLQSVGLILIVALLIIPPAAARFWTDRLPSMILLSATIGALSGLFGSALSGVYKNFPAGAVIVLVAAFFFLFSMIAGHRRGLLVRFLQYRRLIRTVARQHLLRAIYEHLESGNALEDATLTPIPFAVLLPLRSWTQSDLTTAVTRATRIGLVQTTDHSLTLTPEGLEAAARIVRNHRLWEIYLITHADIAPSHVDRDADRIEHILHPTMIEELETLLHETTAVPRSPHNLTTSAPGATT